jgi:hypothetical protein
MQEIFSLPAKTNLKILSLPAMFKQSVDVSDSGFCHGMNGVFTLPGCYNLISVQALHTVSIAQFIYLGSHT